MTFLNSFAAPVNVAVIGASGGIGAALLHHLNDDASVATIHAFSRSPSGSGTDKVSFAPVDLLDEESIENAAALATVNASVDLVLVCSGLLHRGHTLQPEKTLRSLSARDMTDVFAVNTIGPALVAKHFLPKMSRVGKTVFAALSARVGSISDNRLGGWISYRAAKAALNMVIKTAAIEQARRHPECVVAALHPGTVDTMLAKPFCKNVSTASLFTPQRSARHLLKVVDGLDATDSGRFIAWDGQRIEF